MQSFAEFQRITRELLDEMRSAGRAALPCICCDCKTTGLCADAIASSCAARLMLVVSLTTRHVADSVRCIALGTMSPAAVYGVITGQALCSTGCQARVQLYMSRRPAS